MTLCPQTSIANGGEVEKRHSATEVQLKSVDEDKNKNPDSKVPPQSRADSNMQPLAPTSSPTIGNTLNPTLLRGQTNT